MTGYYPEVLRLLSEIDTNVSGGTGSNGATLANQSLVLIDSNNLIANISSLMCGNEHYCYSFPENTSLTITMYAGAANVFGPYNIIKDSVNNTFSDKFNNTEGHISSMLIEDLSAAERRYNFEISYGAAHTPIINYRTYSVANKVGLSSQTRLRPLPCPIGEVLYYRGMCENASANAEVSFRYYL